MAAFLRSVRELWIGVPLSQKQSSSVHLDLFPPPPSLAPYIADFYWLDIPAEEVRGVERAEIGLIRVMVQGAGQFSFGGRRIEQSQQVMVTGPSTAAIHYEATGPCRAFGASLKPLGWAALMPVPADEASDRVIDGRLLFGDDTPVVHERIAAAADNESRVEILSGFLEARLQPVLPAHAELIAMVARWTEQRDPKVADLFAALPLSPRQTTRLVNRFFGGPPKMLARKFRAIRAAIALIEGADPAEVSTPFYDQSHMIREVRHFTGHRPGALRSALDPIVATTLARERG